MYTDYERVYTNYLMHHGTKGMKWGVRRALKKYGSYYDNMISNLNERSPHYRETKKILLNDRASLNKLTSKKDIKNKAMFDSVKYHTIQNASLIYQKANMKKLNNIMEKDWAKNKVQIVKEMKAQRRLGMATVASAVGIYGGLAVGAIGIISGNNRMMNAGLATTLAGTTGAAVAATKASTSKLARRSEKYTMSKKY